jgi:hypothetical protein
LTNAANITIYNYANLIVASYYEKSLPSYVDQTLNQVPFTKIIAFKTSVKLLFDLKKMRQMCYNSILTCSERYSQISPFISAQTKNYNVCENIHLQNAFQNNEFQDERK